MSNYMMTATEVANELGTSRNYAYKVIKELNSELKSRGYVVVAGKIPRAFWKTKFYTGKEEVHGS
ncbi:MAG: DNA-binding protein [Parasporobacterium sp.]|nr:DNA-binding protein [Parasporobacterium sp.]